jgi:hypothetical protein
LRIPSLTPSQWFGGKSGTGGDVAEWWARRDFDTIARYCLNDVRITHRAFCRLTYRACGKQ